jgi:hypothetical protein
VVCKMYLVLAIWCLSCLQYLWFPLYFELMKVDVIGSNCNSFKMRPSVMDLTNDRPVTCLGEIYFQLSKQVKPEWSLGWINVIQAK